MPLSILYLTDCRSISVQYREIESQWLYPIPHANVPPLVPPTLEILSHVAVCRFSQHWLESSPFPGWVGSCSTVCLQRSLPPSANSSSLSVLSLEQEPVSASLSLAPCLSICIRSRRFPLYVQVSLTLSKVRVAFPQNQYQIQSSLLLYQPMHQMKVPSIVQDNSS